MEYTMRTLDRFTPVNLESWAGKDEPEFESRTATISLDRGSLKNMVAEDEEPSDPREIRRVLASFTTSHV
jgi:hypothetical protein